MQVVLPLCLALLFASPLYAQLNTTLIGNLDYEEGVNDIWGYVAPDGTEYAIVGLQTGVSIVSLADPENPTEVGRTVGVESPWRDMKSYRGYAYAVADRGEDGITVIDLRHLPDSISSFNYTDNLPGEPDLLRAHNIYIDTTRGLAFTAGGDRDVNDGGVHVFDLNADPVRPPLVARGPEEYSHDVYVHDSLMFTSEIYTGFMAVYDITDLDTIRELGRVQTPFRFTHNAWSTDDNTYVFTTDERGNASVAAYDISNPDDIQLLDEFRPVTSLNTGSIPHNVHVIGDYLSISSYSDGLRVVDAADPSNLVEVAFYDTYSGPDGGFNGAWGAYPFLPSGLTLVSDRSSGLFVVDVDYVEASRLSGTVTDRVSGEPVAGAAVRILTEQINRKTTDALGAYRTGVAGGGTLAVEVSALGYYSDTIEVELVAGGASVQDFALLPRPVTTIQLDVRDRATDLSIPNVRVNLYNPAIDYAAVPDSTGTTELTEVFDYTYDVLVTVWGYQANVLEGARGDTLDGTIVYLDRGYEDVFSTDLGWTVSGDAWAGQWERGTPTATFNREGPGQPGTDAPGDFGNQAYITGLAGGNSNSNDVDRGETVLTSPLLDLSDYGTGVRLEYSYWFSNLSGSRTPNDTLTVSLSDGDTTVVLRQYSQSTVGWQRDTVLLDSMLPLSDSMRVVVSTADQTASDNLVEAGFDNFRVLDSVLLSPVVTLLQPGIALDLYPNPAWGSANLDFDLRPAKSGILTIHDISGRRLVHQLLRGPQGRVEIGRELQSGLFLITIRTDGRAPTTLKWMKH